MLETFEDVQSPNLGPELIEGLKPFCLWLHPYLSDFLKLTLSAQESNFSFDDDEPSSKNKT